MRAGRNERPDQDQIGTFAEPISVQEESLALKPINLNMKEVSSVPMVAMTVGQVLAETAKLKKGQELKGRVEVSGLIPVNEASTTI